MCVKSKDLCEKCAYSLDRCKGKGCRNCQQYKGDLRCLCNDIKENTPCPYFIASGTIEQIKLR